MTSLNGMIRIQRVYDFEHDPEKGYAILIDRLWPRGIKKTDLKVSEWMKEIGPSNSLRKWFGHDPANWDEFCEKYREELKEKEDLLMQIKMLEKEHKTIVLLYSAKDEKYNNAVLLKEVLDHLKMGQGRHSKIRQL